MSSRKHYHTTRGGLMLAIALVAGACLADVWPSWLSPARGSYDRGNQALSGAVERLTVVAGPDAWKSYITTNIWEDYFSQWAKCDAAKRILSNAVANTGWIYPEDNWTPDLFSSVTHAGLLARTGAPSNWWTVTPRFDLAMDSNGWRFIPDIQSNIAWRTAPVSWYPKTFTASNELAEIDISVYPLNTNWYQVASRRNVTNSVNLLSCLNARGAADRTPMRNPTQWGDTNPDTGWGTAKRLIDYFFQYHYSDPVYLGTNGNPINQVSAPGDWPTNGPWAEDRLYYPHGDYPIAAYPKLQIAGGSYPYGQVITYDFAYGTNYTVDPYGSNTWIIHNDPYDITGDGTNIAGITTSSVWIANGIIGTNLQLAISRFAGLFETYLVPATTNVTIYATNYEQVVVAVGTNTWQEIDQYIPVTNYIITATNSATTNAQYYLHSATKAQISAFPFVGNVANNPYLSSSRLPTNKAYVADIWGKFDVPFIPHVNDTNIQGVAYWDEWSSGNSSAFYSNAMSLLKFTSTNLTYARTNDCYNVAPSAGWYRISVSSTVQTPIVWGPIVGVSNNTDYITDTNMWCSQPNQGEAVGEGWEVTTNTAVIKPVLRWFR